MSDSLAFVGFARITGRILLVSGLHIGAGKDTIEIGGIDNPVIRHPHSKDPYIPGSSIKGKLRYLLEWAFQPKYGSIRLDGLPWGSNENQAFDPGDPILRIFGTAAKKDKWQSGPTRLIVRDAALNDLWRKKALAANWQLTEDKTEVAIDRIQGKARDGGLRQTERVPSGAEFDLDMSFRMYEVGGDGAERDRQCLNWLLAGLSLLEQDALGGSGSRGYGRIAFAGLKVRMPPDAVEHDIGERYRVNRFDFDQAPPIVPG